MNLACFPRMRSKNEITCSATKKNKSGHTVGNQKLIARHVPNQIGNQLMYQLTNKSVIKLNLGQK